MLFVQALLTNVVKYKYGDVRSTSTGLLKIIVPFICNPNKNVGGDVPKQHSHALAQEPGSD